MRPFKCTKTILERFQRKQGLWNLENDVSSYRFWEIRRKEQRNRSQGTLKHAKSTERFINASSLTSLSMSLDSTFNILYRWFTPREAQKPIEFRVISPFFETDLTESQK